MTDKVHGIKFLILGFIREQGGAKLAVEMAEFWLKDQWTNITKDWSGVVRENPWSEERKFGLHANLIHDYFRVCVFCGISLLL